MILGNALHKIDVGSATRREGLAPTDLGSTSRHIDRLHIIDIFNIMRGTGIEETIISMILYFMNIDHSKSYTSSVPPYFEHLGLM